MSRSLSRFAFFACLMSSCVLAQQPESIQRAAAVIDSLPKTKTITQVAMSPDGVQVATIVEGQLSIATVNGGESHAIALGKKMEAREVAWSADGKRLAIIADLEGEVPQAELFLYDGTQAKSVADLHGYVQAPRFSPDGSKLAVLFIQDMPRAAGPLQPMTPLAGVIDEQIFEQRITLIDTATNKLQAVTPADMYVYEYDWLPDGSGWAAIAAHGSGDNNWWIAHLYRADASGAMHDIYAPKQQIAMPHVSPDGKSIAFIEGLMSDEDIVGGDVFLVPVDGGAARNLTPDMKASATTLNWVANDRLLFGELIDGDAGFASVTTTGSISQLWKGDEDTTTVFWGNVGGSFSRDGQRSAVIRQTKSEAPEVWAGELGKWTKLTSLNENAVATWGATKSVHWISGTAHVQGWLTLPKEIKAGEKYPLIISVHGGPSSACTDSWDTIHAAPQSLSGYFSLCPNPRGSYGQGEAFTRGNVKDFGGGDYRDIISAIDALAKDYPIDTRRVGINGHSYGGYMTMWAESQTTRFAAAVAGAGLSDWLSYYGLNDIDEWMVPFFGASVYDDPAVYAKSDPIHFVKRVKTPTLILVGDRDGEVPMEQSVEWWHALKAGHVSTTLVVYPNEGHLIGKPANRRDYVVRSLAWMYDWLNKGK